MILDDVVAWYGSQAQMARRLGVSAPAINIFVQKFGYLPPLRAIQVERQSGGKFRAIDLIKKPKE